MRRARPISEDLSLLKNFFIAPLKKMLGLAKINPNIIIIINDERWKSLPKANSKVKAEMIKNNLVLSSIFVNIQIRI